MAPFRDPIPTMEKREVATRTRMAVVAKVKGREKEEKTEATAAKEAVAKAKEVEAKEGAKERRVVERERMEKASDAVRGAIDLGGAAG